MNKISDDLQHKLASKSFEVVQTPLTEFLKAGGAAKCLTLRTTEPLIPDHHANVTIESRILQLEGHLLDAGIMNKALDVVVGNGGSFKVLNFTLGIERQSRPPAKVLFSYLMIA
ncbi:hypothetical protein MiTe_04860 [Microcystis aeruginosa NIES-2520]|uniref:LOR/SDH bifunctional enzyme conserved domain-containing protein n=1 Tax=Microcystis aeruginosa NIES-2520 TaxID=2303982 RepID=A0A5A5RY12_MICAE|nr:hypothetical protein MiTe_04860 [Microcystis aeruginosa NIES-2520]